MFITKRSLLYMLVFFACFSFTSNLLAEQARKMPPTVVEVVKAQQKFWQPSIVATGSLAAFNGIMLSSEVPGRITKIYFNSGQYVKQGDLLLEIYPDIVQAQLKRAQAQLKESVLDYQRNLKLYKKGFVDKSTLDRYQAARDSDQADVDDIKAQLRQHLIQAPFAGKLGLRKISLGDYVNSGQDLVSLQSVDLMRVDFSVPQVYIGQIKVGDKVVISDANALAKDYTGEIYALDSVVSPTTRMIGVRAKIANSDRVLVPGTFVEVKVKMKHLQPVIVIPVTALVYSAGENYVYLMINHKAVQTKVVLGKMLKNNQIIVKQGLKEGGDVIIGGQLKLFDNSPVITKQEYQHIKR